MKRAAIIGSAILLAVTLEPTAATPPTTPAAAIEYVLSAVPGAGPVFVLDLPYDGHERLVAHPKAELIDYPGMAKRMRP